MMACDLQQSTGLESRMPIATAVATAATRVYACGSGVLHRSSFLKSLRRVWQAGCSDGMAIA